MKEKDNLLLGTGFANGTCGELVQGVSKLGIFHVSLPINLGVRIDLKLVKSKETRLILDPSLSKLKIAIKKALKSITKNQYNIHVIRNTELLLAKGMASSSADIVAGIRAVYDAFGETLTAKKTARLATEIESSDAVMYPAMSAFNHKTGHLYKSYKKSPKFHICMIVPESNFNTESIDDSGKRDLKNSYDRILSSLDAAPFNEMNFAAAASLSAKLNQSYHLNPLFNFMESKKDEFGFKGIAIAHTGSLIGLLFSEEDDGRILQQRAK